MFILQSILFRVVPTALEITMVCGILVRMLYILYAVISFETCLRLTNSAGTLPELSLSQ